MGIGDKFEHKKEEVTGKAKEKHGKVTDDPDRTDEGRAEQSKANLKQAADDVKDAFKK